MAKRTASKKDANADTQEKEDSDYSALERGDYDLNDSDSEGEESGSEDLPGKRDVLEPDDGADAEYEESDSDLGDEDVSSDDEFDRAALDLLHSGPRPVDLADDQQPSSRGDGAQEMRKDAPEAGERAAEAHHSDSSDDERPNRNTGTAAL